MGSVEGGTQCTIPGSQDVEGREELAGHTSSSIPLRWGLRQAPAAERTLATALSAESQLRGEEVTMEDMDKKTDSLALPLRRPIRAFIGNARPGKARGSLPSSGGRGTVVWGLSQRDSAVLGLGIQLLEDGSGRRRAFLRSFIHSTCVS